MVLAAHDGWRGGGRVGKWASGRCGRVGGGAILDRRCKDCEDWRTRTKTGRPGGQHLAMVLGRRAMGLGKEAMHKIGRQSLPFFFLLVVLMSRSRLLLLLRLHLHLLAPASARYCDSCDSVTLSAPRSPLFNAPSCRRYCPLLLLLLPPSRPNLFTLTLTLTFLLTLHPLRIVVLTVDKIPLPFCLYSHPSSSSDANE